MGRPYALILGVLLAGHGLLGLLIVGQFIVGLFNTDLVLDLVYLVAGIALLWTGLARGARAMLRGTLVVVGIVLLGFAVISLGDPTIVGLLPNGLTWLDTAVQFVGGGLAILLAVLPRSVEPLYPHASQAP